MSDVTAVTLYVRTLSTELAATTYIKQDDKTVTLSCKLSDEKGSTGVQSVTWNYTPTDGTVAPISADADNVIETTDESDGKQSVLKRSSMVKTSGGTYSCTFDLGVGDDVVSSTSLYVHFLTPLAATLVNPTTIACVYEGTDDPSTVTFHEADAADALVTGGEYTVVPGTFTDSARTDTLNIDLAALSGVTDPTKIECKYTFTTTDTLASSTIYHIRKISAQSATTYALDDTTITIRYLY